MATPLRPTRADQSAYPAEARSSWDRRKWYILAAICVAQFMVVLDIAIVNVALPSIRTDLDFTNESLQWVLTAYAILFGGFLLLGGRLADRFGRRRVFMAGLVIFTAASLMCGLAWSEASLIAFRAAQGFGGALLSPAALSILATTFTEGRERNLALGIWGGIAGSGAAAGTLLGGVLTSAFGWEWIFFVNVPIGAVLVGLTPFLLSREPASALARRSFDIAGAVTVTGGLMVLVYALTRATQIGWSATQTIALLVDLRSAARRVRGRRGPGRRSRPAETRAAPARAAHGQHRGLASRRRAVLAVLPAHAVHAAGAGVLGDEDGGRLRGHHRHARGRGDRRASTRDPHRATRGARDRSALRERLDLPLLAPAGERQLRDRPPAPVPPGGHRAGADVRADPDLVTHRRQGRRGGRRLGHDQHEPADRRRRRPRGDHHDRHDRDDQLHHEPRALADRLRPRPS